WNYSPQANRKTKVHCLALRSKPTEHGLSCNRTRVAALTMFAHTCRDSRDSRGRGAHLRGDWRQFHLDAGNSHRQCIWLHSELETEQGCAEKFLHALIHAGPATRCEGRKDQCATAF